MSVNPYPVDWSTRQVSKVLVYLVWIFVSAHGSLTLAEGPSPSADPVEASISPEPHGSGNSQTDPRSDEPDDDNSTLIESDLPSEEVVVVWAVREDRPFDRDTKLRLTGVELRKLGVTNLSEALDMLPEINVRAAGRGGRQIDIRGARKGSVKVLIDGIAISDPFYGNIDLSVIPVTDIEEIRIATSIASPIDGVGGPGGVVEVLTNDAVGGDMVRARADATSAPSAEMSVTGRTMLSSHLGVRMSLSATLGLQEFELRLSDATTTEPYSFFLPEERNQSVGAARLEYRKDKRRLVTDIWLQQVAFVTPPTRDGSSRYLAIDGENQGRLGISYDDHWNGIRMQGRAHYHLLTRKSTFFTDPELTMDALSEELNAARAGLAFVANRPTGRHWKLIAAANLESDRAEVQVANPSMTTTTQGRATTVQSALAAHYEKGKLNLQTSAGLAVPIGLNASPWGEFKISGRAAPVQGVEITLTAGHKGRTPTLRERLQLGVGNQSLAPEKTYLGEFAVNYTPIREFRLGITSFVRHTNGLIRLDSTAGQLINIFGIQTRGFESQIQGQVLSFLTAGGTLVYAKAQSDNLGDDPLDFFPRYRGSAWLRANKGLSGITTRFQYWGRQIDRNVVLDPRVLMQVNAYTRFAERYTLNLRATNLSGKVYEERVGVRAPGRMIYASLQAQWW